MKFANFSAMKRVTGSHFIARNTVQLIFRIFIFTLFLVGLAHPVLWYEGKSDIRDYVITIDSSSSMLADDVAPDRLTVAKQAASGFLDKISSYTEIGLVSFAGVSFIKSQMTSDTSSLKYKIENIDIILGGGTDIGGALVASANIFKDTTKAKSIILITDGSDTAGSFVEESVDTALEYIKEKHIIIHTIGIGTGSGNAGYINASVLTPVYDSSSLKKIAEDTGGKFHEAKSPQDMADAFQKILSESTNTMLSFDISFILLLNAFIMLFIEWGLLNTRFRALP